MWTPELIFYGFLIFLILIFLKVPIAFSLGFSSIIIILVNGRFPLTFIAQRMYASIDSFTLLALPLFIFVGQSMNRSGITDHLFKFAKHLVGDVIGSLGHVNVVASIIFAGMSGAATADVAGLGLIEMKAMVDNGFDVDFSAAVTASSSTIGPIIPPSIPLVVYAFVSQTSIGRLFLGGILPGLLLGITLMILIYAVSLKKRYPRGNKYSLKEKMKSFVDALPALFAPILLLSGIVFGVFTPTEGAGVTAIYTLFLGFIVYKNLTIKELVEILKITAKTTGTILIIIAFSSIFSYFISIAQIPQRIVNILFSITQNKYVIMLLINIFLLTAGAFMESLVILTISIPILMPIITGLGINPVHFGVMMILNLGIGGLTPPFGLLVYVTSNIAKIPIARVFKASYIFLIPMIIALFLVAYIPQITLFIPNLLMGN